MMTIRTLTVNHLFVTYSTYLSSTFRLIL